MRWRRAVIVWCAAAALRAQTPEKIERELDAVARVASTMVDGDVCARIVTARAMTSILDTNPRDKWLASDNYDVNHEPFIQTKKTLARLARLVDFPADVNLWMPIPGQAGRIHIVIRGVNETSQFWPWGALHQATPAPMQKALSTGQRVVAKEKPGIVSVLAPVTDSLGDVVGLVEVVARVKPNAHENVK
ncbi:MAG: hypothetical protein IT162_16685 [Bryobacterales bacterium]|nr:hypothetical protein [Bryobacterales bacterium]